MKDSMVGRPPPIYRAIQSMVASPACCGKGIAQIPAHQATLRWVQGKAAGCGARARKEINTRRKERRAAYRKMSSRATGRNDRVMGMVSVGSASIRLASVSSSCCLSASVQGLDSCLRLGMGSDNGCG